MPQTSPFRVLVAGGGFAGIEAALALRAAGGQDLDVEVLAPERQLVYRPLSVRDPFGENATRRYDLEPLVAGAGARLRRASVTAVEPDERVVTLDDGSTVEYDALLLATGAERLPAIPGASTFCGPSDAPALRSTIAWIARGGLRRVAFVVPPGPCWPLPIYELALQAATVARESGATDVQIAVVTPEAGPLISFGAAASAAVAAELEAQGVALHLGSSADRVHDGRLRLELEGSVPVDAVWAAPRLKGRVPAGVPDRDGFVPVDGCGRVDGFVDLFAAGDVTHGHVKQGGVAAQQADVAARAIAALAGLSPEPAPVEPVLRALMLTGGEPLWLRSEDGVSEAAREALWWPAHKVFGRHIAPLLAEREHASSAG